MPAIKPAAEASRSRLISVLATPGTVARDYTRALVRDFAGDCEVELVGSPRLAAIAERRLRDERSTSARSRREIAPCFVERGGRRTDQVVLACTHFPLLTDMFAEIAPWPVDFVDPAPGDRASSRRAARAARPGPSQRRARAGSLHQRARAGAGIAKGLASLWPDG